MSIDNIRTATVHMDSDSIDTSFAKSILSNTAAVSSSSSSSTEQNPSPSSSLLSLSSSSSYNKISSSSASSFHPLNRSHLENPSSLSLVDTDITGSERSTKSPVTGSESGDVRSSRDSNSGSIDGDDFTESALLLNHTSHSSASSSSSINNDEKHTLERMADACKTLLEGLGEDPNREGLLKTPMRMAKALVACTAGYNQDPKTIVSDALFECDSDEMVIVKDIEIFSMCEHHMLPFFGKAHVGYIPNGKVVGLSKLARLTDCFAKRLQIQERLTQQIAKAIEEYVDAKGVAVVVEAAHMCMAMRGVEKPGALTVSSCFLGQLKEDRYLRTEFLTNIRTGSKQ